MALIIVESPNKIPKIRKVVGPGYVVMASVGHIMDLEKKDMGIEMPSETVTEVAMALMEIVGFGFVVYGQMARKDLAWGLFRK